MSLPEVVLVQRTFAIIKPDAVAAGKTDAVLAEIEKRGLKVVSKRQVQLSKEEAETFYEEHRERPFFGELVTFMTSGPIVLLCLEGENAIAKWREIMGPTDTAKAKAEHPSSMRALFGTDKQRNATHGSDSIESAARELGLFFPHKIERTFAIIKPDAVKAGSTAGIIADIQAAGFKIVDQRETTLTLAQAQEFYAEHKERPFYGDLCAFMTSGPVVLLCLERANAIKAWRAFMGPTNSTKAKAEAPFSLRAKYGTDGQMNATHGSDSAASAFRELNFFFPKHVERTFAIIKPDAVAAGHTEAILKDIEEHGFFVLEKKEVTLTKEQTQQFYIEHKDRPFYGDLTAFMSGGKVVILVLARPHAIKAWRTLMGPTNSHKAREAHPDSLRAKFGVDGQANATHGSDSTTSALREIGLFFPEFATTSA